RVKEAQNVNLIFISSLFKKNNNYLGLYKFKNLTKTTKKKVIALGGISKFNKKKLKLLRCYGFSGISYFE
ncbi:thiamine phosphate synthase, partial [Candidatus Pelagibacter sp.]|nr:thiamine phosphate synthase [Candidatus Pelagibacter sp.]